MYKLKTRHKNDTVYIVVIIRPHREALISTKVSVPELYWSAKGVAKSHPNAIKLNTAIQIVRGQIEDILLQSAIDGADITPSQVKEMYGRGNRNVNRIADYLDSYCERLKGKRSEVTIQKYRIHIGHFIDHVGNIDIGSINDSHLTGYERYLRELKKDDKPKYTSTYIFMLIRMVRQLINDALKHKVIINDPFILYERPQYRPPKKDFLTFTELSKVENFEKVANKGMRVAALYFLFGCYTGLRVSDWYNFDRDKHIHNDFIELEAEKNKKPVNIPISAPLKRILAIMEEIPLNIEEPTINKNLKLIMTELNIHKHITTHCGRHTFAITMCLGLGVSSETAAKIMGITLATFVDNYSQVTQEKIERETKEAWKRLK